MTTYNMPWARRVTNRIDDIYIASDPSDLQGLLKTVHEGDIVPSITAYELREVINAQQMPLNVSVQEWNNIKTAIADMETKNLFIEY